MSWPRILPKHAECRDHSASSTSTLVERVWRRSTPRGLRSQWNCRRQSSRSCRQGTPTGLRSPFSTRTGRQKSLYHIVLNRILNIAYCETEFLHNLCLLNEQWLILDKWYGKYNLTYRHDPAIVEHKTTLQGVVYQLDVAMEQVINYGLYHM